MRRCAATVVGESGVEDGAEWFSRYDIGGTRTDAHHVGIAAVPKEVEVASFNLILTTFRYRRFDIDLGPRGCGIP
jgi:hypothetical protein